MAMLRSPLQQLQLQPQFPKQQERIPISETISNPIPHVHDEKREQAQRQQQAKKSLTWMQRAFVQEQHHSEKELDTHHLNPMDMENGDGSDPSPHMALPDWAVQDGKDPVQHRPHDADKQVIDPMCQNFNHTIIQPNHGCQVNPDTWIVYCAFEDFRIDPSKIQMTQGGEPLSQVMGRSEEVELPVYQNGAFSLSKRPVFDVPTEYRIKMPYMDNVLNHLTYPTSKKPSQSHHSECVETWKGTTLLITRFEYVNLYHTMTDWWNTFSVLIDPKVPPQQGSTTSTHHWWFDFSSSTATMSTDHNLHLREVPQRVLFLDGHAQGNLDSVWTQLFGPTEYVMHVPSGGLCLERAVLVPPGYVSTLFPNTLAYRIQCPLWQQTEAFVTHVLGAYHLTSTQPIPGRIVLIDRQPYVSHPRSNPEEIARGLTNFPTLVKRLQAISGVTSVEVVRFETMSFEQQLRTIRQAQVLIGNHGAGLTHSLLMDRSASLIELNYNGPDFFSYICEWSGVDYTPIQLDDLNMLTDKVMHEITRAKKSFFRGVIAVIFLVIWGLSVAWSYSYVDLQLDQLYKASLVEPLAVLQKDNNSSVQGPGVSTATAKTSKQKIDATCKKFNHTTLHPTHGCQSNPSSYIVYCAFQNLRIDNSRIKMDRGGEWLSQVMGRSEEVEFPIYQKGAISVPIPPELDISKKAKMAFLDDIIESLVYPGKDGKDKGEVETTCAETWKGTTLVITRYEYVNLYHTLTDWWNTFLVLPEWAQREPAHSNSGWFWNWFSNRDQVRILFLDGHAQGGLDSVWSHVFGPTQYIMHTPHGGLCLEHAVIIPPGYVATLFPKTIMSRKHCPLWEQAEQFSNYFLRAYGLESVKPIPGKVVFVDRQPYVSHPRSKPQNFERQLSNVPTLKTSLNAIPKVSSVDVVYLETMSFGKQIRTIRQAQILIGNHGAGLSHVMFMDQSSSLIELTTSSLEFFSYLCEWNGVHHTSLRLQQSTVLTNKTVESISVKVASILSDSP
eukprot:Nitzschia sp. Nitz4//scaffold25_size161228//105373//108953//NITZ4_002443-RA/size161228-snap-gene-0.30-mRNA-1//-1//CDS//3329544625//3521//frame0